jgi:hypothetical protein
VDEVGSIPRNMLFLTIVSPQRIQNVKPLALFTSMYPLVFKGQSFGVVIVRRITNCRLFQKNQILLTQPNPDVQFPVSVEPLRTLIWAIRGTDHDDAI